MCHIFLKYPIHRRRCKKHYILTEIIFTALTKRTGAAGLPRLQCHTVPNLQIPYITSGLYNDSSGFMSQHKRFPQYTVSHSSILIKVYV